MGVKQRDARIIIIDSLSQEKEVVSEDVNRPLWSCLLRLCQNESSTYMFIFMQIKLIFI